MNSLNAERIERMQHKLTAALSPSELTIQDDSHLHVGHAGAKSGKGHFTVHIKSDALQGLPKLQQHRRIYDALGEMMEQDIHALVIVLD